MFLQPIRSLIAYIVPGLDVGPSLAEQVGDLGVTIIGGYGQGGEPILSETKRKYELRLGRSTCWLPETPVLVWLNIFHLLGQHITKPSSYVYRNALM